MSDLERDEQIRRLEQAMLGGTEYLSPRVAAIRAYDAGARIPDPPKPSLPVVSHEATKAHERASHEHSMLKTRMGSWYGRGDANVEASLRAAWPIMLRDSIAALRLGPFDNISNETMCAIFRQLAGAP